MPVEQLVLIALFVILTLFGGASRADEPVQMIVRMSAIAALAYAIFSRPAKLDRATGPVMAGLAAAAFLVAVQLIPLPFSIWSSLPGRALYAQQGSLIGAGEIWRPLTLSPDQTWNALLSLIVPISVVALLAKMHYRQRAAFVPVVLAIVGFSMLVALARLMSGSGWIALRQPTDGGGGGIFANRNHQALLFVIGLPALAVWVTDHKLSRTTPWLRWGTAAAGALLLIILIPATGSRTGLLLGTAALVMALIFLSETAKRLLQKVKRRRTRKLLIAGMLFGFIGLIGLISTLNRAEGVRRLMSMDIAGDTRTRLFPRVVEMTSTFFPVGTGFGTFNPAFRRFEGLSDLKLTYFNQAHDDFVQIVLEGGLPGALILVIALGWLAFQMVAAWRSPPNRTATRLARLASILMILMLGASIVDYPLRTPLMAALFALFAVWLHGPRVGQDPQNGKDAASTC
ncbi:O-antigen ligase family protein [Sphingomonas fuzhouensis]|uniref:O-antigen ligase family protein n=1 Tax=Sphingomonas fuzhouensis TaxID=3106033 RepID=UPI002AFEA5CF|nr:O-antigen ligase family protein [Sphingomonas sp. SGZ-02]